MVKRAATGTMPISLVRICRKKNQKGFTLIEILFVLGIITFIVAITIPKLGRTLGTQLKSTTRKIITLSNELHSFSRIKNKTYRLVIQFGDVDHKARLYVESASKRQLMAAPDAGPTPELTKEEKEKPENQDPFSQDKEFLKVPIELPRGVQFEDVENDTSKKPITEGKAYVIFFPEGLVERSVIHITDGKKIHWSLIINPLTGHTDLETEYIKLKDLNI
jgi:general secretion pathway protein H